MIDRLDNVKDRYPADTELKFSGTITASVTHELNNVISILNQTGGLLEDFIFASENGNPIPSDKLKNIAEKLRFHSERGIEIIKHLNKFAHSSDIRYGSLNLNELIENLGALMNRFVALKGAVLSTELPEKQIQVTNDPFKVQQVVFLAMKVMLKETQKGNSIVLSLNKCESINNIKLKLIAERDGFQPDLSDIRNYINEIGAEINADRESDSVFIEIGLPAIVEN